MTTKTRLKPLLWLSDARGVYIPRDFVNSFADWANVKNVSDEDKAILEAGPDHEWYWEAWDGVCRDCVVEDNSGNRYTVYQDGDCWLIPEGMPWEDDAEFFAWPDETEGD